VLIDIGFPHLEGIAVARQLRRQFPATRMVFCSITDDEDTAVHALRVGAVGYVRKDLEYGPLSRALRGALAGEAAISRQLGMRLIEELYQQSEPQARLRPAGGELTGREWEVLDLLIDGASTAEIAKALGLALETVRSHVKHVLRKLGVGSRGEAIDIARRLRGAAAEGPGPRGRNLASLDGCSIRSDTHLGTKITNLFGDTSPTSLARASRNRCSRSGARMSPQRRAGL